MVSEHVMAAVDRCFRAIVSSTLRLRLDVKPIVLTCYFPLALIIYYTNTTPSCRVGKRSVSSPAG